MIVEDVTILSTPDDEKIALWKIFNDTKDIGKNIFLTHGTFSNKNICLGISKYFVELGYTCYIMEWRNHGKSSRTLKKFNFETIAFYDLKTVFNYLFQELQLSSIHCITHSGGGISLSIFLIKHIKYHSKIDSITLFACQAFGATAVKKNHLKILISKYLTYLIGYIPSKPIRLGPHNENYFTMKQWFNWNLKKNFLSTDNTFDYKTKLPSIKIPIYSISAKGDKFIAPTIGCKLFFNSFNNSNNLFKEYAIENKNLEDYNHSRVILSKNASKEIWPSVLNWIEKNSN